jgi:putative transferase (TIGR04331 family)
LQINTLGKEKFLAFHLVTTADERTWSHDKPMLFLGDWCLRYDRRIVWEGLDYVIAPPVNVSSVDRKQAAAHAQKLTGQLLPELAAALNRYHGVQHGQRYWQILLGHWLQRWVSTACNRFLTLERALDSYDVGGSTLLRPRNFSLATKDSLAYIWATNDDLWNHILWGEVLSHLKVGKLEPRVIDIDTPPCFADPRPEPSSNSWVWRILRTVTTTILSQLAGKSDAVIISSYLPVMDEVKLNLALKQFPQRWRTPAIQYPFPGDRCVLARELFSPSESNVAGFIRDLLPKVIPSCFVEGYQNLYAKAAALPWPSQPSFIFTSNNFDTDEVFKSWAALKSEQGIPYLTGQHGNHYGTHFYYGDRSWPERSAADGFLTWGWSDGYPNTIAAFNFKTISGTLKTNPAGGLLLIETSEVHRDRPWDATADHLKYLLEQFHFVRLLPQSVRRQLTIRLPNDVERFQNFESKQWTNCYPELIINDGNTSFKSLVRRSRLVVFSYDSTGILEMLASNTPFICFWPNTWDHLLESAIPYYESLRNVGIYHDSAESAADMVIRIWDRVSDWWESDAVQRAREGFCERYSRSNFTPIETLSVLLKQASMRR